MRRLRHRRRGKIRYIGFTGHKDPAVHLRMLAMAKERGFQFATAQMPINVMDAHFRSFTKEGRAGGDQAGAWGVLAMKTFGDHFILDTKLVEPIEMLHYSLSLPVSVVITGIDSMEILDQSCEAARTFQPMSQAKIDAMLAKTKDAASKGEYELFKTTPRFDGTAANPKWLGEGDYPKMPS